MSHVVGLQASRKPVTEIGVARQSVGVQNIFEKRVQISSLGSRLRIGFKLRACALYVLTHRVKRHYILQCKSNGETIRFSEQKYCSVVICRVIEWDTKVRM